MRSAKPLLGERRLPAQPRRSLPAGELAWLRGVMGGNWAHADPSLNAWRQHMNFSKMNRSAIGTTENPALTTGVTKKLRFQ